jgi:hypothetical protein
MSDLYQSRVFTFIGNQANQLKNTCAQGLRHLKVAVVWGSQILLYPFQLLAQTTIFQPQIASPPSRSTLPQPTPDLNIEQALDLIAATGHQIEPAHKTPLAIDDWSYIDENLWNTSHGNTAIKSQEISYTPRKSDRVTRSKPIIRGLSSLLVDRQLVLVTIDNELLDILTISQQQEIRRRIGIDLATTWQQWHSYNLSGDDSDRKLLGKKQLLLNSENNLERQTPPKNLFDRFTDWLQQNTQPQPQPASIQADLAHQFTDRGQLLLTGENNLEACASSCDDRQISPHPNLFDRLNNWLQQNTQSPSTATSISLASVDANGSKSIDRRSPSQDRFTPPPPSLENFLELPQLPPIHEPQPIPIQNNLVREIVTKLQSNWFKKLWNYYRDYLHIPSSNSNEIIHQPSEFELIPIEPKADRITSTKSPKQQPPSGQNSVKLSAKFYRDLEHNPDWIEAESELIGYNRSLLARCLAWLDRIVLSIENWLITIWNKITNRSSPN